MLSMENFERFEIDEEVMEFVYWKGLLWDFEFYDYKEDIENWYFEKIKEFCFKISENINNNFLS